jgi:hypothetical protein
VKVDAKMRRARRILAVKAAVAAGTAGVRR